MTNNNHENSGQIFKMPEKTSRNQGHPITDKVTGTIAFIDPVDKPTPKLYKCTFGLNVSGCQVYFELVNNGIEQLNGFRVGDPVTIGFELYCRPWDSPTTGKTLRFVTLRATDIERVAVSNMADTLNMPAGEDDKENNTVIF